MAASAKMSYNHFQSGKYGTLPTTAANNMEVSEDMHLKMSKKIAQLTKVIYALNTKNDEHEAVVQQLKEQHEDEMQKLLKDTKDKVGLYKAKLDTESFHNKKIEQLEKNLKEHDTNKQKYLGQFEAFKKHAEERETKLKTEHSQKMLELSQDVLHAKKDFEEKLKQFEQWKEGLEAEREKMLSDIKNKHESEMEEMRNYYRNQNDDWLNEVKKVEDKYKNDLETLQSKTESLEASKNQMAEEYEAKLAKAQLFYEKELEAVMSQNNVSQDEAQIMLQKEKEKMKKDFAALEAELKKQINSLLEQVTDREDEVEKCRKEIAGLEAMIQDTGSSTQDLHKQLQDALRDASSNLAKLKEAEDQLTVMKERCSRQEDEMLKKSTLIGQLEATKLQNESTIQELEAELNRLRDKLSWLEKERMNLEMQKSDLNQTKQSQLQSLERALEDLSIEKQTMKERFEKELDGLRNNSSKSQKELLQQHQHELDELRKQGQEELAKQKQSAEELLEKTKQELIKKHTDEMVELTNQSDLLKAELERVKSELGSRLKAAEDEVARLNGLVQNTEQGLGSATSMVNGLKEANSRMQQQLESARADHKQEKMRSASLQSELDKLRMQHEAAVKGAKLELQRRLGELTSQLDNKWQETLRVECNKLRQEIGEQKENEMRAALEQLSKMKDDEIAATRSGWEGRVQDLTKEITNLKARLTDHSSQAEAELERLRQEAEAEQKRLEKELLDAANEYLLKVQTMESVHEENTSKAREHHQQELEELKTSLTTKHVEDMQAQTMAHKATVDSVKEQAEMAKMKDLQEQSEKAYKDKEDLKNKLYERHTEELQRKQQEHESHLVAARMELERAVEISKQKEKDHMLRVEDLQGEITSRERHITNLKEDATNQQTTINHLNKEIDFKRLEIQKIKSDTQNQIRIREKQLHEKMEKVLDNMKADHIRESQQLITQFNEAQELLKDKISEIQIELQEAEERYANRESRPEDLELIEQLRDRVLDKEEKIKALVEEKKFYQLELVNRETNFNKVFSATPNVGVLNPLDTKKRRGDKPGKGTGSAPNLSGRLDPLPGSPLHSNNLNPTRPLPPFAKKFVR